ncbi:prevent-host-death family protein [Xylanimonas cellulosilytica DSM 15894]|uniref:Prevent-host-death family protein n=1 Tax=Xylanimonas cellulosilytica (strain DSM 15894 / JCM 12276 / CECT 5975 / KCTC 9989 / LMG 20990 / NBRC 107835 / XIL07) TaxID=446471 RepID=D1BUJ7_XYLCX|nr:type II toxin-antitoxin system Phd/YefM family antitoxin [Xylanimonas cellulosilytica]ACZ29238.1 prevent-host-death family protein [Xylanimonas cellulosilytica DSM 15894]
METINVHDAKTHLSRLLARVEAGETLSIGRGGKHVAYLTRDISYATPAEVDLRFGFMRGHGTPAPEDFDTMHAEEIRDLFEGTST